MTSRQFTLISTIDLLPGQLVHGLEILFPKEQWRVCLAIKRLLSQKKIPNDKLDEAR